MVMLCLLMRYGTFHKGMANVCKAITRRVGLLGTKTREQEIPPHVAFVSTQTYM